MSISKLYNFSSNGDERGSLVVIDKNCGLPFQLKRVYYIFGTQQGISRGHHAHKKLHQIAVCLSGSCRILIDNGKDRESIILKSPKTGIDLPPMLWHEMHDFSNDCILLVLASDNYDEKDYIRNYEDFMEKILI